MAGAVTPIFVFDERGQEWVVYPGDPAWPYIKVLYVKGVREISLPRTALLGQGLTDVTVPATMRRWDVSKPAVGEMFRRLTRLQDCIRFLREHPTEIE